MIDPEIQEIARLLGATIVAELPDVLHGATGAAHCGTFYQLRMAELRRQEQERAATSDPAKASPGENLPSAATEAVATEELAAVMREAEKAVEQLTTVLAKARQLVARLHPVAQPSQAPDPSGAAS
jgi:hypothetical protein